MWRIHWTGQSGKVISLQSKQPRSISLFTSKKRSVAMVPSWLSAQASCLHCATLSGGSNYSHGNGLMQCFLLKRWIGMNQFIDWNQNLIQAFQVMLSQHRYITIHYNGSIWESKRNVRWRSVGPDFGCPSLMDWIDTISNPREILTPHMFQAITRPPVKKTQTMYVGSN